MYILQIQFRILQHNEEIDNSEALYPKPFKNIERAGKPLWFSGSESVDKVVRFVITVRKGA